MYVKENPNRKKRLSIDFFFFKLSDLKFDGSVIFICRITITLMTSVLNGLVCFFTKTLLHYKTTTSNVNRVRMQTFHSSFFIQSGFSIADTGDSQCNREGRGPTLFLIIISIWLPCSAIYLLFWIDLR